MCIYAQRSCGGQRLTLRIQFFSSDSLSSTSLVSSYFRLPDLGVTLGQLSCLHLPSQGRSPRITDRSCQIQHFVGSGGWIQVTRFVWQTHLPASPPFLSWNPRIQADLELIIFLSLRHGIAGICCYIQPKQPRLHPRGVNG